MLDIIYIARVLLFVLIVPFMGHAQDAEWIRKKVEVPMGTQPQTKNLAIKEAHSQAVQEKCGVGIEETGMIINQLMATNILEHVSYGVVLDDSILKADVVTYRKSDTELSVLYQLEMNVRVQCISGNPDPAFQIDLETNKNVFNTGEELILRISSTKDCYITVFNILENQEVVVLHPSFINKDNFIKGDSTIEIPSQADREMGVHLRVAPLPKYEKNREIIKVIATKERIDFLPHLKTIDSPGEMEIAGGMTILKSSNFVIEELARWLVRIPPDQRTEDTAIYEVHAR